MQKNMEWKAKYFSTEAKAKVMARRGQLSPEAMEQANRAWSDLYADVQASLDEDPAGPKGQKVAARWEGLIEDFTGGDADILQGLKAMIADRANWPADARAAVSRVTPEVEAFIQKAVEAARCKPVR
jgi:MerR family transcriptional regulator, thiopeptide resistance regulator